MDTNNVVILLVAVLFIGASACKKAQGALTKKKIKLKDFSVEVSIPGNWVKRVWSGTHPKRTAVTYRDPGAGGKFVELEDGCPEECGAPWQKKVAQAAKDKLWSYRKPNSYWKGTKITIKQNGENAPGKYVLHVEFALPKKPSPKYTAIEYMVWHYRKAWKSVLRCRVAVQASDKKLFRDLQEQCLNPKVTPTSVSNGP
jgi:hypothetical protein